MRATKAKVHSRTGVKIIQAYPQKVVWEFKYQRKWRAMEMDDSALVENKYQHLLETRVVRLLILQCQVYENQ